MCISGITLNNESLSAFAKIIEATAAVFNSDTIHLIVQTGRTFSYEWLPEASRWCFIGEVV